MVDEVTVDVLVAGGGVGGVMAAYRAQKSGATVLHLGASAGASHRISVMNTALEYTDSDTPAGLFDDMFRAGGYLNNPSLLAAIAARAGAETIHLASLGVPFAQADGRFARRQAAGSSRPRGVYTLGMVGVDILRRLRSILQSGLPPATLLDGAVLVELYTDGSRTIGGLVYDGNNNRWIAVRAGAIVLATGGAGQIYSRTTNPRGSAATGYAIALEAGCELIDMEFVSFEPFVTWAPGTKGHDLPTTVLREGARLRNGLGAEFMDTSRAPAKDIICRAMVTEVLEGRGTASGALYYDLRDMDPAVVQRYPQIQQALKAFRYRSDQNQLEVMPAQHYLMGGVRVDARGASSLPGLYAVGEVAGGAHGAHRLAGAGGTEVVALGAIVGENAASFSAQHGRCDVLDHAEPKPELLGRHLSAHAKELLQRVRGAMESGCGILRNASDLGKAVCVLEDIVEESRINPAEPFVTRAALVALVIAGCSQRRQESRGDHFRQDHPSRDDTSWLGNIMAVLHDGREPQIRYGPLQRSCCKCSAQEP